MKKNFWDLFDDIVCINLVTEKKRLEHCRKQFVDNGIENVKFYHPERDPQGGMRGCFQSHVAVVKEAYERGSERLLIFEDDIIIKEFDHLLWRLNLKSFFKLYPDFNMLFFYYNLDYTKTINNFKAIKKSVIKGIYEYRSSTTHAYVLSRKCMEKIKDLEYDKVKQQIDSYYIKNIDKQFSINPPLVVQSGEFESSTLFAFKSLIPKVRNGTAKATFILGDKIIEIAIIVFLLCIIYYVSKCEFCQNKFGKSGVKGFYISKK